VTPTLFKHLHADYVFGRLHAASTLGYLSPMAFEEATGLRTVSLELAASPSPITHFPPNLTKTMPKRMGIEVFCPSLLSAAV